MEPAARRSIPARRSSSAAAAEAIGIALLGGALGFEAGRLLATPVGAVTGVVAALNGAVGGWRGVYAWRRPTGWLAFVLDSTWSTPPVLLGLVAHVVALLRDGGYDRSLSARLNRHVYRRGAHLQAGYVFTIGNVISSAGDVDQPRRRKLIVDHEDVHIWQARWWGPAYLVAYLAWSALGALGGVLTWLRRGRREPIGKVVRSVSYYMNPFEWWAYCRDDLWPPSGLLADVGWRRRIIRPFSSARTAKHLGITDRQRPT